MVKVVKNVASDKWKMDGVGWWFGTTREKL